jgi:hypothetical protein
VVEPPAKSIEVLAKPARPPRTTPTYGVPIVKPDESTPVTVDETPETGEIEEADMVAGEIEVRQRDTEVSAPTTTVVVDSTPKTALGADDSGARADARTSGGGVWMVLGVGGIAVLGLVVWKLMAGGGEEPPKVAQAAADVASAEPPVTPPDAAPVAMGNLPTATEQAVEGGTLSAPTGTDDPVASTSAGIPSEADAPPNEQEASPAPQEDVEPTGAPPQPEKKPKPKKKKKRTPSTPPDAGDDPTPTPPKAPEPPPKPSKAAKKQKANELLTEARKASMKGEYGKAWRLASESYSLVRNVATLQVMGVAACKMGDRAKARKAYGKLPEAKRGSLASVCASNGITLE